MQKKILFIFLFSLLICLTTSAQSDVFDDGILLLRTGDSLKGQVKLSTQNDNILFKKNGSRKKLKFDSRKVKKIIMQGYDSDTYVYKITGGGQKPRLLQEVIIDENLSLLKDTRSYLKFVSVPSMGSGGNGYIDKKLKAVWYIAEKNSDFVEKLPLERKKLLLKFNHCQAIVQKYRKYDDEKFFVVAFMRHYIENCSN